MGRAGWETYFERLGPQGVRLVAATLLSPHDYARLTGEPAADLSPAARGQRIAELIAEHPELAEGLLAALDERAGGDEGPREAREIADALARVLRSPGAEDALFLHRLAREPKPPLAAEELRAAAEIVAPVVLGEDPGSRPKNVAKLASERAGLRELERERRELEERVRKLEAQLARAQEHAALLEEKLARRTQELHDLRQQERQAREERLRLERELARLRKRIDDLNERRARERTGEITTALRRLTTEQRRATAQLEKFREADRDRRETLRSHERRLERLADLVEKLVTLHEADSRSVAAAQAAIMEQLAELRDDGAAAEGERPARRPSRDAPPRVGVFVDVQNMFYGAREKNARLDFEALLEAATSGRQLVRAVAYLVEAPDINQAAFIHLLETKAYEVKRKPLRIRPDRSMKGNWDLEMALDALTTAKHVDIVVLVTGDGDFVPLVRALKLQGKRVEVYGFRRSTAPDLRQAADRFHQITRRLLRPLEPARAARRARAKRAAAAPAAEPEPASPPEPRAGAAPASS